MAVVNPPSWLQAGNYSALSDRLVISSIVTTGGVADDTDFLVTQTTTPSMTVNVAAGTAFVYGTQGSNQGVYHVYNNGNVTRTISPSSSSGTRIDRVVLRVYDAQYSGSANKADIEVVTGTATTGTPSPPSLPASSIELARVTVSASATSISNANISHSTRATARLNDYMINTGFYDQESTPTRNPGWRWYQPSSNLTKVSDGSAWNVTGKPNYSNVSLASGWSHASGHQLKVGLSDGLVRLRGGRLVRTSTTLAITSETDYTLTSAMSTSFRPAVDQEMLGFAYLGNGIPNPIRIAVGSDGIIRFRAGFSIPFTIGTAMFIVVPPMTWITD